MTREEAIEHLQSLLDYFKDRIELEKNPLFDREQAKKDAEALEMAREALNRQTAEEAAENFAHDLESGYYKTEREETQDINRLLDEKEQDEIEKRIWKMVKEKIKEEKEHER